MSYIQKSIIFILFELLILFRRCYGVRKVKKTSYQYYADFNRVYEELNVLFSILQKWKENKEAMGAASYAHIPREFAIIVRSCTFTGDK